MKCSKLNSIFAPHYGDWHAMEFAKIISDSSKCYCL